MHSFQFLFCLLCVVLLSVRTEASCRCTCQGSGSSAGTPLKIAGFNIQVFGRKKMAKCWGSLETNAPPNCYSPYTNCAPACDNTCTDSTECVQYYLIDMLRRYDITLIEEIRDASNSAIWELLANVNNGLAVEEQYDIVIGARMGRSTSKEQYAYLFKKTKFSVVKSIDFADTADGFEREPFLAQFHSLTHPNLPDFVMIGLHSKPDDASPEVERLLGVYDWAKNEFPGVDNYMFLGDWNFGCSYASKTKRTNNLFHQDTRFKWLFETFAGAELDTTVAVSDCPYDRFVVIGDYLKAHAKNPLVINYQTEFNLDIDTAKKISDHWPIVLDLEV